MRRDPIQTFFFVHVMKTAGGTVREHLYANFAPDERFPNWSVDPPDAYFDIGYRASTQAISFLDGITSPTS